MPRHGHGKSKIPTDESNSHEESGWQGMRAELPNMVHGISHAFGRGSSSGSSGDLWLHQLSKLRASIFKCKGGPEESEAWLQRVVKMLESMTCPVEYWVQLVLVSSLIS